jgi:hypothetical protein
VIAKYIIKDYLFVNFASLNLSATDANQFTVTSYGTLKTQLSLFIYNKRLGLKLLIHQQCFKNNVVSSFKHTFTNNIAGSVSAATKA